MTYTTYQVVTAFALACDIETFDYADRAAALAWAQELQADPRCLAVTVEGLDGNVVYQFPAEEAA